MNKDKIISQPTEYFDRPEELVKTKDLNYQQKIDALKNWKQTCIHLQESTAEGMYGGAQTELQRVSNVLYQLEH